MYLSADFPPNNKYAVRRHSKHLPAYPFSDKDVHYHPHSPNPPVAWFPREAVSLSGRKEDDNTCFCQPMSLLSVPVAGRKVPIIWLPKNNPPPLSTHEEHEVFLYLPVSFLDKDAYEHTPLSNHSDSTPQDNLHLAPSSKPAEYVQTSRKKYFQSSPTTTITDVCSDDSSVDG